MALVKPTSSAPPRHAHAQVHRVLDVLTYCSHNGFPVINNGESGGGRSIMGIVLRQHLLKLLSTQRCFQASPFATEVRSMH